MISESLDLENKKVNVFTDNFEELLRKERVNRRAIPNDIDSQLKELKKIEPTSDNIMVRLNIIGYEYGDLQRALVYAERFRNDDIKVKGYYGEGKLAVADMITMLHMLCISLGWNFEELRKYGVEHLKERQHDFIGDRWC